MSQIDCSPEALVHDSALATSDRRRYYEQSGGRALKTCHRHDFAGLTTALDREVSSDEREETTAPSGDSELVGVDTAI